MRKKGKQNCRFLSLYIILFSIIVFITSCAALSSLEPQDNKTSGNTSNPASGSFLIIENPDNGATFITNVYPFMLNVKIYCASASGVVEDLKLYTNSGIFTNLQNPPQLIELKVPVETNSAYTFSAEAENSAGVKNYITNRVEVCKCPQGSSVLFQPSIIPSNPFAAKNEKVRFAAPISNSAFSFKYWRYDLDGDGVMDTDWTNTNRLTVSYAKGGTVVINAEAALTTNGPFYYYKSRKLQIVSGGSGSFSEYKAGQLTNVQQSSVALGDIDGDGDLDLILTGANSSGTPIAKIYQNDGSGSFSEINAGQLTAVNNSSVALGDIDNDGHLDLILTGLSGSTYVAKVYHNDGKGSFSEIYPGRLTGVFMSCVALGDIDNDGNLDLILMGTISTGTKTTKIYKNDGTGYFTEINAGQLAPCDHGSIQLGDINGDGNLDVILSGSGFFVGKSYTNNGKGAFTEINAGQFTGVDQSSSAQGDIDNDGNLDLILFGNTSSASSIGKIYKNNGLGSFTEINPGKLVTAYYTSSVLGDINGDSTLDLIMTGSVSSGIGARIYSNNGSGSFTEISPGQLTPAALGSTVLGDIDGDGDLDIILTGSSVAKVYKNQ